MLKNGMLSGALNVTGNSTIYGTLSTVRAGSYRFMVDGSGSVSANGALGLPTLQATFVNNATALNMNFCIPTSIASTTYQEFITIANMYSGTLGLS